MIILLYPGLLAVHWLSEIEEATISQLKQWEGGGGLGLNHTHMIVWQSSIIMMISNGGGHLEIRIVQDSRMQIVGEYGWLGVVNFKLNEYSKSSAPTDLVMVTVCHLDSCMPCNRG
jgi:hypothetical protein